MQRLSSAKQPLHKGPGDGWIKAGRQYTVLAVLAQPLSGQRSALANAPPVHNGHPLLLKVTA
eukprot:1156440-Pelagomonas_calceolata.AAC.1